MREHDLHPKQRRRYVATTDSDHASPIFKNLTKGLVLERPNQLWIADLTHVAIPGGFVYLAAILDAWSRKVGRLRHQPIDGCAHCDCRPQVRHHGPPAAQGVYSPFRSRIPIRLRSVPRTARRMA